MLHYCQTLQHNKKKQWGSDVVLTFEVAFVQILDGIGVPKKAVIQFWTSQGHIVLEGFLIFCMKKIRNIDYL